MSISSNSWGATDDGLTYATIGDVFEEARGTATREARNGKGLVILWAAGNGANSNDGCSYDATNCSPYVMAVGAINSQGVKSSYSEACAALFVGAPSSDTGAQGIRTLTIADSCRSDFGGKFSNCKLLKN